MKPFDLQAALEGKPVQRHNGVRVPHIHVLPDWVEDFFPVISKDEDGVKESHTIEGRTTKYPNEVNERDLFMADEEVVEYWNFYDDKTFTRHGSLAEANYIKTCSGRKCIGQQKATLVDGKITKAEVV